MTSDIGKLSFKLTVLLRIASPPKRDRDRISEREIILLSALGLFERLQLQSLAQAIGSSVNVTSSYVRRLSNRGLIERSLDNKDARVHWLSPTPEGLRYLQKLEAIRGASISSQLNQLNLPSDKMKVFGEFVEQVYQIAEVRIRSLYEQEGQPKRRREIIR